MAYQNGTATGADDLLSKLNTFAAGLGWTVNTFATISTPATGKWLFLNNGSVFASIWSDNGSGNASDPGPFVHIMLATSYNSGANANAQPNASGDSRTNKLTGPFTNYYFFAPSSGTQYIHVVVEVTGGVYKHFHIGTLDTIGSYTGGQYCAGSSWWYSSTGTIDNPFTNNHNLPFDASSANFSAPSFVCRADIDTFTNKFWQNTTTAIKGGFTGDFDSFAFLKLLRQSTPNAFNGLAPMFRLLQFVTRAGGNYSPLGSPADLRYIDISNLNPAQSIFLGSDEWKVFPVHVKNGATGSPNSATLGFAYKKIP